MSKIIDDKMGEKIIEMYKNNETVIGISRFFNGVPCEDSIRNYLKRKGVFKYRKYYKEYSYEQCLEIAELYKKK